MAELGYRQYCREALPTRRAEDVLHLVDRGKRRGVADRGFGRGGLGHWHSGRGDSGDRLLERHVAAPVTSAEASYAPYTNDHGAQPLWLKLLFWNGFLLFEAASERG